MWEVEKMSGLAQAIADTANTETAKRMIRMQRYSADEIASISTLEKQTVLDLANEMNIPLQFKRP